MAPSSNSGHNPDNCPDEIKRVNAELKAEQVLAHVESIPKENRGKTNYVNYEVSDIPDSEALIGNPTVENDTFFDNALEAEKYRELLLTRKTTADPSIPTNPDDIKRHVKALFQAFKCVPSDCQDTLKITGLYSKQTHDNPLTEALCWQLMEGLIHRSQVDTNLVESHEPEKYKFRKCADKNFAQRFNLLKNGMAKSKSLCKHLNDAPFMYKVLDDPTTNVERIESNRKLNGQKAQVMKRGKQELEKEEGTKKQKTEQKTEHTQEESPLVKTESAQRLRLRASAATSVSGFDTVTPPARTVRQVGYPNSAPAYGMQQTYNPNVFNGPQGLGFYPNTRLDYDTPTRGNITPAMTAQGMHGFNPQAPFYGHHQQLATDYRGLPPPRFGPIPPMSPAAMQGRYPGAAIPRSVPRASGYPELTAPSQSAMWLTRPQPETRRSSTDHNSGASTMTAPEMQDTDHSAADPFALGDDSITNADEEYEQDDITTLIDQAEQENAELEVAEWDEQDFH